MELRIGVREGSRELSVETDMDASKLKQLVHAALEGTALEVTDSKGRTLIVPTSAIAFVEIGSEDGRRVGFIA